MSATVLLDKYNQALNKEQVAQLQDLHEYCALNPQRMDLLSEGVFALGVSLHKNHEGVVSDLFPANLGPQVSGQRFPVNDEVKNHFLISMHSKPEWMHHEHG